MKTNADFSQVWDQQMMTNYGTPTITIRNGEGSYVWDVEGKKYLDLLGGIAVSVIGHCHPLVVNAITEQASKMLHTSNLYAHESALDLAAKLTKLFGRDSKVFFCQDGATAIEAALKLVRKYGFSIKPDGTKQVIVAMHNGFHGRTSGALSITGNAAKRDGFGPFGYEVRFADFNDIASLESVMGVDVAAVVVEPVQGEGGMNVGTAEFLKTCQRLAKKYQALLVVDEVQSGVGRTGSFFNFTQHDLQPDIVTLAKGLAGGLPIGAVIATKVVAMSFAPGDHGSTFGGNPVSTAAANVVLDVVTDKAFSENVVDLSNWFANSITQLNLPQIKSVNYSGMWFGIELNSDNAAAITKSAAKQGFLVNAVKSNVLRLAPALNISREQLQSFLDILPKLVSE
jgi:acetylornithine aminotransferase